MPSVTIRQGDLASPVGERLTAALNAELTSYYPEEEAHYFRLNPSDVAPGVGTFLVAYNGSEAIGCGAVRRLGEAEAEIKRMYVVPTSRGQGVGRSLLSALEEEARALGADRLLLETGDRLPEALALYVRAGFSVIPRFGEYVDSPLSLCMAKDIS